MPIPVITYDDHRLTVLDQTRLPQEERLVPLEDLDAVAHAIRTLQVRGAPLIGVTAAYGTCVALRNCADRAAVQAAAPRVLEVLRGTRPTAVNLFWALDRMEAAVAALPEADWLAVLEEEARRVHDATLRQDAAMAEHGQTLLRPGARCITHCNTGPLATGGLGTALGVLIGAHKALGDIHVYVDETRPRWQGARLTTWELGNNGVPYTLITDNAAATLMRQGGIHSVWVGADRIAANGDTANKIGTYGLAVAARHHGVPFYVVAPTSTIDPALPDGDRIPIEERDPGEVARPEGHALAPANARAWNPAFDVTPAELIAAIVTEKGVHTGPHYDLRPLCD